MRKIAVTTQKGGTGKTTTATNVATGLAMRGNRVLLVDLDPQAATTAGLGIEPVGLTQSMYDVMMGKCLLSDIIEQPIQDVNKLWLAPSHLHLSGAEVELASKLNREGILTSRLKPILSDFDYVIVDTGPNPGILFFNAVAAVDEIIVPMKPDFYSSVGTMDHLDMLAMVHDELECNHDISILFTMYRTKLKEHDEVIQKVANRFPGGLDSEYGINIKVFKTIIPLNTDVSKAPMYGLPVIITAPESSGGMAYENLINEIEVAI